MRPRAEIPRLTVKEKKRRWRKWYRATREKRSAAKAAYFRDYNRTPKRRALWRARAGTPEYKARQAVARAVKSGRLVRPDACSQCGKAGKPHGHHADYSKPLEVQWLCVGCHERLHHDETG